MENNDRNYIAVSFTKGEIRDEEVKFYLPPKTPNRLTALAEDINEHKEAGYVISEVQLFSHAEYLLARLDHHTKQYLEAEGSVILYEEGCEAKVLAEEWRDTCLRGVLRGVERCINEDIDIPNEIAIQVYNYANKR